ncbi:hypothetical protein AGRHK599_LOCUS459 [Rhizobium rhizogenes]|uniref:Spy/CpxP family protein refolding chaperone n=1 Tax=Rhizobium rhizogenes TaxID=359 RepID=A0AAN2A036_RHIRH|nr:MULTISPECIES: hypothetical protein [Rhizobium/Agrobacterium group]AQS62443.1 hypothetical protein B0909_09495 [Rhizobium rhizogenes]MBO0124115.1 hypothetical protein [Agrobacterium sp. OT33]MCZ7445518.1 hypothetical protein [Rhizobium rhizogenes]NSZ78234.1 hypothetical protein [Agrobacterium tumefaciens]OAM65101.1 hypothetical protein A8L48_18775 [Rhizobium rhizogenes]
MRSLFKTVTIASFILAAATGGAFAAGHSHGEHSGSGGMQSERSHDFDRGGRHFFRHNDDDLFMNDTYMGYASPVVYGQGPHLVRVLHELRVADHRIDFERQQGRLSASAFNRLENESSAIRNQALKTADMHRGYIPMKAFATLQGEVRQLDRNIVRMS